MVKKMIDYEIQKRLKSEIWEKKIAKKIHYKLMYDHLLKYKKIAIIIIFIASVIISYKLYNFYKFLEQNELLANFYFEYKYSYLFEYLSY